MFGWAKVRERRPATVKHSSEVGIDDLVPLLQRHLGSDAKNADPRVVNQDVQPPESRNGVLDRLLDLVVAPNVGLHRKHRLVASDRLQFARRFPKG